MIDSGGAGAEPVVVISCLEDMTVMGQPVEKRRRHLRVTKDVSSFTEAQIGCDDDTGALVEAAEQMEQQGAP